jgi:hypothetical protein
MSDSGRMKEKTLFVFAGFVLMPLEAVAIFQQKPGVTGRRRVMFEALN